MENNQIPSHTHTPPKSNGNDSKLNHRQFLISFFKSHISIFHIFYKLHFHNQNKTFLKNSPSCKHSSQAVIANEISVNEYQSNKSVKNLIPGRKSFSSYSLYISGDCVPCLYSQRAPEGLLTRRQCDQWRPLGGGQHSSCWNVWTNYKHCQSCVGSFRI